MAWTCLKKNIAMGENNQRMVFMVETEDIATPPDPDYSAVGSVAFTADMTGFWVKAASPVSVPCLPDFRIEWD